MAHVVSAWATNYSLEVTAKFLQKCTSVYLLWRLWSACVMKWTYPAFQIFHVSSSFLVGPTRWQQRTEFDSHVGVHSCMRQATPCCASEGICQTMCSFSHRFPIFWYLIWFEINAISYPNWQEKIEQCLHDNSKVETANHRSNEGKSTNDQKPVLTLENENPQSEIGWIQYPTHHENCEQSKTS